MCLYFRRLARERAVLQSVDLGDKIICPDTGHKPPQ